jgi:hypothetical protein
MGMISRHLSGTIPEENLQQMKQAHRSTVSCQLYVSTEHLDIKLTNDSTTSHAQQRPLLRLTLSALIVFLRERQ